jgi:hypothetical protein
MRRLSFSASVAVLVTAALAAACTDGGSSPATHSPGPWSLARFPAIEPPAQVRAAVDAPPAREKARILGLVELAGTDAVLAVRGDFCQVFVVPDPATGRTDGPFELGAQRPTPTNSSTSRNDFPGTELAGSYTQAHGIAGPYYPYLDLGCSDDAMIVRIEGVAPEVNGHATGDARTWRADRYTFISVGQQAQAGPTN